MGGPLSDKIAVVTGANSGIGKELCRGLAREGARVFMLCRNPEKGRAALDELASDTGSDGLELMTVDVSSLASLRAFADEFQDRAPRVDLLMNNAGLYTERRTVTVDGRETMFGTNHLGAFALTALLMPKLLEAERPRVITTSSMGHKLARLDWDDLDCERRFGALRQYGASKLMNILFTRELSRRYEQIAASCFHPGAVGTNFAQQEPGALGGLIKIGKIFLRTPAQGADTGLWLATSEVGGAARGGYYLNRHEARPTKLGRSDEAASCLWQVSEELTGLGAAGA